MKFKCSRDEIVAALQMVQTAAGGKGTIPILSNVLFEAGSDSMTLTATDLEVGMRKTIPAKVAKKGSITLPAKRILAILRELPVSEVAMEASDQKEVVIKYDSSYFRVMGLPREDFPPLPEFEKYNSVKVAAAALADLVRKTHYAISHDESRYVLNGLYLLLSKGLITGVATDGRRLALCEIESGVTNSSERGIIVPTKAVLELGRILTGDGEVVIFLGENQAAFKMDSCVLVTRLIEGHYPNYRQVVPQRCTHKLLIDREELLAATRRAAILTSEQCNSVKFNMKKNRIVIHANTPEVGEAQEELIVSYPGEEVTVAFNPQYLVDALKNLGEKEISFEFTDALNPGVLRSGKSFLYVIMPIRIS